MTRMTANLLKDFLFVRATSLGDCPSCGCPACVGRWDDGRGGAGDHNDGNVVNDGNDGMDVIYCGNPDCPVGIIWKWERSQLVN
jgi:hypothetical protein